MNFRIFPLSIYAINYVVCPIGAKSLMAVVHSCVVCFFIISIWNGGRMLTGKLLNNAFWNIVLNFKAELSSFCFLFKMVVTVCFTIFHIWHCTWNKDFPKLRGDCFHMQKASFSRWIIILPMWIYSIKKNFSDLDN